jgi:hypothetical protein
MVRCRREWRTRWLAALAAALPLLTSGCDNSAGQAAGNGNGAATSSPSAKPGTLPPGAKTVALAAAGDRPYDKTFDDLRFDIKPGDPFERAMLPPKIVAMEGQRIRIRGYILPAAQQRGIKTFVLVRDNQECCFGPGAALYDCILVEMVPGKTVEFSIWPVAVEGTFGINEVKGPDGTHLAIYRIEGEEVR